MNEKGQCEKETVNSLKKCIAWHIEFEKLSREMGQKNHLFCQILIEHAKRIDKQEQRLILLEKRVYDNDSAHTIYNGPC